MPGHKAPEAARREQILKAAFCIALRERLSGLKIRDVAGEAGLSSGLVLFHFKTKDTLVAALLEWLLDSTRMLRPKSHVRGEASAAACLGTLIGAEARRISTDRRRSELFFDFWVAGTRNARLRVQMRAALTKYRLEFRELAAEMLASRGHRFAGATAEGIAAAAVSFVHGCAIQAVIDPEGFDLSTTLEGVEALANRAFVTYDKGPARRGASSSRAVTRKRTRRRTSTRSR
jgi:TetR/AcrR family transcriptional repressor of bet genes